MFDSVLEYATKNLRVERLLIQAGLDPENVTFDAIFSRLLDIALANITFANTLFLVGAIFLISTFVVRTIVPLRILSIVSSVFFLAAAALAGSIPQFFLYLLALPINLIRLFQIRNLVKKARSSARGDLSLDWLKPYMTARAYKKGDMLFAKGDPATDMLLTVSGKFLVTEIGVEIPAGRIMGELGFVSPTNQRTQSVECTEDGDVLAIAYEKLHEIYLQNPEFGYFFLRLTTDRLLQNFGRLEGLVEESKAALAAAAAAQAAKENLAGAGEYKQKSVGTILSKMRATAAGATRRRNVSGAARGGEATGNILARMPKPEVSAAEEAFTAAEIEAAERRVRAYAVVDRYANYCGASGFIPVPLANMAAVAIVLVRMVKALSALYGVPYVRNRSYGLVIGIIGGVMPSRLAAIASVTAIHLIPGVNFAGLAVSSVSASYYAREVGRMLVSHFEREAQLERQREAAKPAWSWRDIWRSPFAGSDRAGRSSSLDHRARGGWLRR
jgi:CRP-like cAMP-binding protein/uncharacterized protein (DUF697 family)